jgi:hypothetical protein
MPVVRGKDFKLYVNDAAPVVPPAPENPPEWLELSNVRDVTRNLTKALADASTRLSDFRQQVGTLKELSLDTQIVYDPTDPLFLIIQGAFDTDANLDILDLDGSIDVVGSKGLRFRGQVTNFTTGEALEDVGLVDITFVVGYDAANPPHGVEVVVAGTVEPAQAWRQGRTRNGNGNGNGIERDLPEEALA